MKRFIFPVGILLLVPVAHFIFTYFGLYHFQIAQGSIWIDNILHGMVGLSFGMMWYRYKKTSWTSVLAFVLAMAILWELFEWGVLALSRDAAYKYMLYSSSFYEANEDIVSNLLGGVLAFLYCRKKHDSSLKS